jgi:hypothetical protein
VSRVLSSFREGTADGWHRWIYWKVGKALAGLD